MPRKRIPTVSIELKPSKIDSAGIGIFAVRDLKKGEIIGPPIYKPGVFLTWKEIAKLDKTVQHMISNFCIGSPDGVWSILNFDMLPALAFSNHNCNYNIGFDEEDNYVAVRDIIAGEELSNDYGLMISDPNFRMECKCGAVNCRKVITGNDWRFLKDIKHNKKYLFSTIRDL